VQGARGSVQAWWVKPRGTNYLLEKKGLYKCGPSLKMHIFLYINHFLSAWPVYVLNSGGNWMTNCPHLSNNSPHLTINCHIYPHAFHLSVVNKFFPISRTSRSASSSTVASWYCYKKLHNLNIPFSLSNMILLHYHR